MVAQSTKPRDTSGVAADEIEMELWSSEDEVELDENMSPAEQTIEVQNMTTKELELLLRVRLLDYDASRYLNAAQEDGDEQSI